MNKDPFKPENFVPHRIKLRNGIVIYPAVEPNGSVTKDCARLIRDAAQVQGPIPDLRSPSPEGPISSPPGPTDAART